MTLEEHLIKELSKKSRGAADLAKVVSLAVLVEPQLLRRARTRLLKDVDAGAEADLWLSPLVQTRSPRGITLLPRVAERLRRELAKDSALFDKAWKLTAETHLSSPPTVKLEEEINRLSVKLEGESLDEVERLLRSVVSTLVDDEERWGLAHWAAGALARMPEAVRRLEPARVLTAASYLRLNSHMPAESGGAPNVDLPKWLSWVLPKNMSETESEFGLGVQLVEGGVRLGGPADSKHTIPVPDTNPLLVELSWPEGEGRRVRQVRFGRGEQRFVAAPSEAAVQLRTMTGLCYELTPAAAPEPPAARKLCYVSMPFGEKIDFQTGRKLNMDAVYRYLIKPAVEEAGFECVRADEIVHSGNFNVPMYRQLLEADLVISDVSTSNPTVFYELGVRHALRPYTTIIISEDKFAFPFDVSHTSIRKYKHLGDDIGAAEVGRFNAQLKEAITEIFKKEPRQSDSPIYTFLNGLTPPQMEGATQRVAEAVAQAAPETSGSGTTPAQSYGELMRQADEAQKRDDFATAKSLLSQIRGGGAGDDPYVIRRLALVTYKSKQPTPRAALEEARELLLTLDPATSNDTETLGMWGDVHRRLWEETGERANLDEAARGYKRAFYLRNDYYNGINLAYLLNLRADDATNERGRELRPAAASTLNVNQRPPASTEDRAEAIADFVQAERVRREVLQICEGMLDTGNVDDDERFRVLTTMAEAMLGVGDEEGARRRLDEAYSYASAEWTRDAVEQQMGKLRALLADSPLKYVKADGE